MGPCWNELRHPRIQKYAVSFKATASCLEIGKRRISKEIQTMISHQKDMEIRSRVYIIRLHSR